MVASVSGGLALALCGLLLAHHASAASMNVHALTGVRALQYFAGVAAGGPGNTTAADATAFNAAVRDFPEAVLAGADFPDFM